LEMPGDVDTLIVCWRYYFVAALDECAPVRTRAQNKAGKIVEFAGIRKRLQRGGDTLR